MRITMSSKQYTMLQLILKEEVYSQGDAALYLQPTFTSCVKRGWLATELDAKGEVIFKITPAARATMAQFKSDTVLRTINSTALSTWLDGYVKRSLKRTHKGAA